MLELPPDLERWLEEEKEAKDKDADYNPESRPDRSMVQNEFYDGNGITTRMRRSLNLDLSHRDGEELHGERTRT